MDFIERLVDKINDHKELSEKCSIGYLEAADSFVIYPLPGSKVINHFMNGEKDQQLNYQLGFKSKNQKLINDMAWKVYSIIDSIEKIESKNNSFQFDSIEVIDAPFINKFDETGYFVFLLTIQATLKTFKESE